MCLFLIAIVILLVFKFSGDIEGLKLVQSVGGQDVTVAIEMDVIYFLWPVIIASILLGIIILLLLMKLVKRKRED